jgi:exodeoxyribonuclease VII large subunit
MARLPFNPKKMKGPAPPESSDDAPWSVRDLAARIGRALQSGLPAKVRVVGEISNPNNRSHWYFSLKDEDAVVSCVMFASDARKSPAEPEPGQRVLATGRVDFYPKQGRTQLYVERLERLGAGALEAQFRALCEELRGLGWFDADRKRPLPPFPRRVCVITSRTGAALQDVLDTMRRRFAGVDVLIADVRVQGDGAAPQIASTLRRISKQHGDLGVDAIILTRGGGSLEDLWAFNERVVAEAIIECAVPVVAAIGHETDTTIAELVADERAATPTQAAMRLVPDRAALAEQLDQLASRMRTLLSRHVRHEQSRLRSLARRPWFVDAAALLRQPSDVLVRTAGDIHRSIRTRLGRDRLRLEHGARCLAAHRPEAVYAVRKARLQAQSERLERSLHARLTRFDAAHAMDTLHHHMARTLRRCSERVDALERELVVVGPANVLARGYSVTTRPDGSVVKSTTDVREGDAIETRLSDGAFVSTVGQGGSRRALEAPTPLPPRRPHRRTRDVRDQMDLFGDGGSLDTPTKGR